MNGSATHLKRLVALPALALFTSAGFGAANAVPVDGVASPSPTSTDARASSPPIRVADHRGSTVRCGTCVAGVRG